MKKLIIDTDLGGDCDDAGALAIAHICQSRGECEILAITHTTSSPYGPACIDAINTYYHHEDIPLGVYQGPSFCTGENYERFDKDLVRTFPSPRYADRNAAMEAVSLLRKTLASAPDGSVTLALIGPLRNGAALLKSPADSFSPLSGVELVKKKVSEVVLMGGDFANLKHAEYNIAADVLSAASFIEALPCPVVFLPYGCGRLVKTGQAFFKKEEKDNPVAFAYTHFTPRPRPSWDPLTVLYAIEGAQDVFALSEFGNVVFDQRGHSFFTASSKGQARYLKLALPIHQVEKRINDFLEVRP